MAGRSQAQILKFTNTQQRWRVRKISLGALLDSGCPHPPQQIRRETMKFGMWNWLSSLLLFSTTSSWFQLVAVAHPANQPTAHQNPRRCTDAPVLISIDSKRCAPQCECGAYYIGPFFGILIRNCLTRIEREESNLISNIPASPSKTQLDTRRKLSKSCH